MVRATLLAALVVLSSCGGKEPAPARDTIRQASGLAVAPDAQWLFVANGNWDRVQQGGTVNAVDLEAFHAALASPREAGRAVSSSSPCRRVAEGDDTIECMPQPFIDAEQSVVLGDGLGNLAIDTRGADAGPYRLLMPQRAPAALVWIDVVPVADGIRLECGQDEFGVCDSAHVVRRFVGDGAGIAPDPSRIVLDDQGFRFGYLPHLIDGQLTLVDLDGELGPELSARTRDEFYRSDPFDDFDIAGGFSVAAKACDPSLPADVSRDCQRPLLYTSHRYWPGIKSFTIAAGLEVVLAGGDTQVAGIGAENVISRPITGDLAFEDPSVGDSLLVVQTTPGSLARLDTSIDPETNAPRNTFAGGVGLCSNPNVLTVHRPQDEEWLALVSCFSDGLIAVVGLSTFTVIGQVQVGEGPNEMAIDAQREQLYVANSRDDTISVVSLDRQSPDFLTEWARLGVGAGSREPR